MDRLCRMKKSRDEWKQKSVERADENRNLRKKIAKLQNLCKVLEEERSHAEQVAQPPFFHLQRTLSRLIS